MLYLDCDALSTAKSNYSSYATRMENLKTNLQTAVDNYCKYHHNDTNDCLNTFTTYQGNMFKDILTTNANIILDNGLLSFLEPFFTVSRKEIFNILTERFNKYEISVSIYAGSFRPEVACKKSHEGAAEVYKFISRIRENVTRTCCHKYYEIINDLMMSGYVDIEKFGAYIIKVLPLSHQKTMADSSIG